jgi:hypothetical protein
MQTHQLYRIIFLGYDTLPKYSTAFEALDAWQQNGMLHEFCEAFLPLSLCNNITPDSYQSTCFLAQWSAEILMWDLRYSRQRGWWYCSEFWRRVDSSADDNVSDKHTLSIFSHKAVFMAEDEESMFVRNVGIYRQVCTKFIEIVMCATKGLGEYLQTKISGRNGTTAHSMHVSS